MALTNRQKDLQKQLELSFYKKQFDTLFDSISHFNDLKPGGKHIIISGLQILSDINHKTGLYHEGIDLLLTQLFSSMCKGILSK